MNKKWFISLHTQWRVVGNSVGISNGRYEPKLESPVGRGGSNKENPLWGWGGGEGGMDIFWTSMFPIFLCPRNGDSSPLNPTIGTFWTLLNKLNRDTTHFDSEDDYCTGCQNVSHCQQQQSYSGLRSPGRSNSTYFWNDSWVQTFHKIDKVWKYKIATTIISLVLQKKSTQ